MATIKTTDDPFAVNDKRFHLPGTVIQAQCAHCSKKLKWDGEKEYLAYPTTNRNFPLNIYCSSCDETTEVLVQLTVKLELA
jgi:hypothetical protein